MNRTDRLYALVEELRAVAPRPAAEATEFERDSARQRVAFTWTGAVSPDRSVGGIDLFQYGAGRIAQAWSWTGGRPFTF